MEHFSKHTGRNSETLRQSSHQFIFCCVQIFKFNLYKVEPEIYLLQWPIWPNMQDTEENQNSEIQKKEAIIQNIKSPSDEKKKRENEFYHLCTDTI